MANKIDGIDLYEYVNGMAGQLTERIEQQRQVLLKVIDERRDEGRSVDYCPLVDCMPRQKYRAAVLDAIQVIEETRRSFKSRQLEELRKRLGNLLAEDAARQF
jgi:hypothetical protein